MVQNLWTTSFFHASPPPYHLVKICLLYSHWCFWPFPLSIQFHVLLFVLIAVFHKNTPNTGCPVLGVHISIGGTYQKWGGSFLCGSFCILSAASPARADSSVPPYSSPAKGRFCPPHLWPGFPGNGRSFCRKVVLCPGKSTGRLLRPFIPPFLTDFTMFFAKKALQMNFKNILYNYRFNFFTQIVSYRFVWGSRVCAFCTASALR